MFDETKKLLNNFAMHKIQFNSVLRTRGFSIVLIGIQIPTIAWFLKVSFFFIHPVYI